MKTLKQFLGEMAPVPDDMKSWTFYHGTHQQAGEAILASGVIKPGAVKQGRGQLDPVAGRTYMTKDIKYAQIYAIGGDMAGSTNWQPKGRDGTKNDYGYVFGVSGHHLGDIQPDEDSVGEMAVSKETSPIHRRLAYLNDSLNSPERIRKMKWGEYAHWAAGGKKILKHMGPQEKIEAIKAGAHVAAEGEVPITSAWRIHKDKIPMLKRDGSNFFDHAEKIL